MTEICSLKRLVIYKSFRLKTLYLFDLFVIPSNNIEQWLIARQRIGKQNNDASNENWKGMEYNRIIRNMKLYSKFECISLLFRAEWFFKGFCCRLQNF